MKLRKKRTLPPSLHIPKSMQITQRVLIILFASKQHNTPSIWTLNVRKVFSPSILYIHDLNEMFTCESKHLDLYFFEINFSENFISRCARAPTVRVRTIFFLLMEISHENEDFLFFQSSYDQNRSQNNLFGAWAIQYGYGIGLDDVGYILKTILGVRGRRQCASDRYFCW